MELDFEIIQQAGRRLHPFDEYEWFDLLIKYNRISISSIKKYLKYSYEKAEKIVNELISCKGIEKKGDSYKVLSMDICYDFVSVYLGDKPTDYSGYIISKDWQEFAFGYKEETDITNIPLEKFKQLIKDTFLYFQRLNLKDNLSIGDKLDISYYSSMRIINTINNYASDKVVITSCNYNNYDDLSNYPKTKCQITIKATQLIAESLAFAISSFPEKKLTNIIGVIYNGTTIYYDIEKANIDDIIKAVTDYPYSKY